MEDHSTQHVSSPVASQDGRHRPLLAVRAERQPYRWR